MMAILDQVDDIEIDDCVKTPALFRVMRDGKKYRVSRLQPGDTPR